MPSKQQTIANRFIIDDLETALIGEGAMGTVYRGQDTTTGGNVAIKILRSDIVADNPDLITRFMREGEALRQLDHPNIVKMLANFEEDNKYYLVMEHVSGGSLRELLNQEAKLPLSRVLQIALELTDALTRTHHLNIIHRDLKPANILLAEDGTPRLTDFGIAHMSDRAELTKTGLVFGTMNYLSPEACNGQPLDVRSDIWSLGIILYEMIAGERPFAGKTVTAILTAILTQFPPELSNYRTDTPPALIDLINRMLQKEPAQRVVSMRQVAFELESILQGRTLEKIEKTQTNTPPVLSDQSPTTAFPSSPQVLTPNRQKQLLLLDKVNKFWVNGVLQQSVPDGNFIDLTRKRVDQLVERPWAEILETSHILDTTHSHPLTLFQQSDRSLLILGGTGAGKTMTLLMLAQDLVTSALADVNQPIPVVLNLSSWAEKRYALDKWLVEEMTAKYQVPRQMGKQWLEDNQLTLLLDGLDEMPRRHQVVCIDAINLFREEYGLCGLVICCRVEEYENAGKRLKLGGAILLEPLTSNQIDNYLDKFETELPTLRTTLQYDEALQKLAQSPLMLNVIRSTYSGTDSHLSIASNDNVTEIRQKDIFQTYVQRMYQQVGSSHSNYVPQKTNTWLSWLASKMDKHNQTVFLIEQLQPSWLPTPLIKWLYILLYGLGTGIYAGLLMWLVIVAFTNQEGLPLSETVPNNMNVWLYLFIVSLGFGIVFGLIHGFVFNYIDQRELTSRSQTNLNILRLVFTFLVIALLSIPVFSAFDTYIQFFLSVWEGLLFLLIAANIGKDFRSMVKIDEALSWSWQDAGKGVLQGVAVGIIFFLISIPGADASIFKTFIQWILPWSLVLFTLGGFRGRSVDTKTRPNQGIWLSMRNGTLVSFVSGFALAAYFWLFGATLYGSNMDSTYPLFMGLLVGSISLALYDSCVMGHYLLRIFLWVQGSMPWRYAHFLDHAHELTFLRKVGGGYIFVHRSLREYFASLVSES